jgi:hypothetical protein
VTQSFAETSRAYKPAQQNRYYPGIVNLPDARGSGIQISMLTPTHLPPTRVRRVVALPGLVLALCMAGLLAACSAAAPPLNSERIEREFGSVGVDVIKADGDLRMSSLYSGSGDNKVTRTIAVVRFTDRRPAALAKEHAAVLAGQSLGAVFKAAGWQIDKNNIFVGELRVPPGQALLADLMRVPAPETLAAHVYLFVVSKNGRSFAYANIVELHHPDYLSAADLKSLYGEVIFDDSNRTSIDDFIDPGLWKN